MSGFAYLVGAGPWSPGLLTVRGRDVLSRADVVLYDYLVNPALLEWARADVEQVSVGHPPNRMTQEQICDFLVERTQAGQTIVRLKGGDPFVFGRGGEEAEALAAAGLNFEVVPGVTAAVASAAYAGIPVTHRAFGSTLGFCTGHFRDDGPDDEIDWSGLASMSTIIFYMAAKRLGRLRERLTLAGRDPTTPVALVRWATRPDQETVETTIGEMEEAARNHQLQSPMIVVVGHVVSLRNAIEWAEKRPLFGHTIGVTRNPKQAAALVEPLRELGADVVRCPTIDFEPGDVSGLQSAIDALKTYDWVVFTSANGVEYFFEVVRDMGLDARVFGEAQIAVIGPGTAARLADYGLRPDIVPQTFVAEGLLSALDQVDLAGRRILIPRAEKARDILPDTLRARGADVNVIAAYRTVQAIVGLDVLDQIREQALDHVTFTAASTVENFCALFDESERKTLIPRISAACIGPITADAARAAGFRVDVVADEYTIRGLVRALEFWGRMTKGGE